MPLDAASTPVVTPRSRAMQRALRAARAVTLSVFALSGAGCGMATMPLYENDAARADAPSDTLTPPDAPPDVAVAEAAVADAAAGDVTEEQMRCDASMGEQSYLACCAANHWNFELGCGGWGPFVPPAMEG